MIEVSVMRVFDLNQSAVNLKRIARHLSYYANGLALH